MSDTATTAPPGQVAPGNIDLHNRPVVRNADGTISTVRSITIEVDGSAVLIPTVVGNRVVSNEEAIDHYQQTGEHLGIFRDEASADAYAQSLHEDQAAEYGGDEVSDTSTAAPVTERDFVIPLGRDLLKLADAKPVSAERARSILAERMEVGIDDPESIHPTTFALATLIVRGLSEDNGEMSEPVLRGLDLRPYVEMARNTPGLKVNLKRKYAIDKKVPLDPDDLTEIGAQLEQKATNAAAAGESTAMSVGEVGIAPGYKADQLSEQIEAGNMTPAEAQDQMTDWNSTYGEQAEVEPFNEDDVIEITTMPPTAFADAIEAERAYNEANGLPLDTMQTGLILSNPDPRGSGVGTGASGKKMSLQAVLDLPNTLSRDQVINLQDNLAQAGYFDRIGAAPVRGLAQDEATQKAWDLALLDAYKLRKTDKQSSVMGMLVKRGATYKEEVRRRNESTQVKTWRADTRMAGDAMAQEALGRSLTDDEFSQVTSLLQGMRRDRMDDITGIDDLSYKQDPNAPFDYGFSEAEAKAAITDVIEPEATRQRAFDAWQKVNQVFKPKAVSDAD